MLWIQALGEFYKTEEYKLIIETNKHLREILLLWINDQYTSTEERKAGDLALSITRMITWDISGLTVEPGRRHLMEIVDSVNFQQKVILFLFKNIQVYYYFLLNKIGYYEVLNLADLL